MKFKLILAGVLFSLMSFAPEQVFAKSSVSTFRIPESNLQSLAVVYVEPIKFSDMDENEIVNLQKICAEIFGEQNFIAEIVWERAYSPVNLKKHFSESHDYLLCYAKNIEWDETVGEIKVKISTQVS